MGFHRLTVPTYFGGLPGSYDYINNAVAGTPAPADGAKGVGVNAGTYFIAFGEDATSSNSNRANAALAENCDIVDDTLRGSQVVMRYADVVLGAPANNIALTGDIYVGGASESPAVVNDQETRNRLVCLVDDSGNDVVVSGVKVVPSLIDDGSFTNQVGVPADGFYTNPTVRLNQTISAGTYRIYYLVRRHLTDIVASKPGEYFGEQIRTAGEGASLYSILRTTDLYLHGVDDLYRRASAYDATPPTTWPGLVPTADTAGNGAWFVKDSWPFLGYVTASGASAAGTLHEQDYHFGATYASEINANFTFSLDTHRSSAGSGFVALGRKRTALNDPVQGDPGLFGFFHGTRRDIGDSVNTNDATVLEAGDVFTLSGDQLTLGGGWFYKNLGGADRSAFVKFFDIIVMEEVATGDIYYVTVSAFTSATVATIRYLDGSEPNLTGSFNFVDWISPLMLSAEDAGAWHFENIGGSDPPHFLNGFVYAVPPKVRYTDSRMTFSGWARIFAPTTGREYAMSWGGYDDLLPASSGATFAEKGYLCGDGGATFGGAILADAPGSSSAANDTVAVLETTVAPVLYKLLWERATATVNKKARFYTGDDGSSYFTVNARFGGSTSFYRDVAGTASIVTVNASGAIFRQTAPSDVAGSAITWGATQNVTKYTLEDISLTSSTPAWSNATTTPTVVTGLSKSVSLLTGDIVKVKAELVVEKTGTTDGAQIYLAQGGTVIADSVRWLDTEGQTHVLSISTQFEATADGSLTFAAYGSLLGGSSDNMLTLGIASLQVEVLRPG
jgi:hypothetical protein